MSFIKDFKNIFNTNEAKKRGIPWKQLSEEGEIAEVLSASEQKPQVIYKHSTRCATSFFALKNLETLSEDKYDRADYHMVNVIKDPSLSQYIAEKLNIIHESPQLLLLENKKVSWNGSHQAVQSEILEARL